jgi:N-methylhydantoinase A/oxoprolinase/acetone carboxylase beta subunit
VIRIGIDVGGTNTDADIMDGERVIASFKAPTSPDVMSGVSEFAQRRADGVGRAGAGDRRGDAGHHALHHAVVQRRGLAVFLCRSGSGRPQRERNERRDVRAPDLSYVGTSMHLHGCAKLPCSFW